MTVGIPSEMFLLEGLQIMKRGISTDVFKFVPSVETLTFEEKFTNEKAQPKAAAPIKQAAPAPRRKRAAPQAKSP